VADGDIGSKKLTLTDELDRRKIYLHGLIVSIPIWFLGATLGFVLATATNSVHNLGILYNVMIVLPEFIFVAVVSAVLLAGIFILVAFYAQVAPKRVCETTWEYEVMTEEPISWRDYPLSYKIQCTQEVNIKKYYFSREQTIWDLNGGTCLIEKPTTVCHIE